MKDKALLNPDVSEAAAANTAAREQTFLLDFAPIRYQTAYWLLIIVSSLDITLTWFFLDVYGAGEINPFADIAFRNHSIWGLILYKFGLTVFFIVLNEEIGRKRDDLGRRMSRVAVVISSFPIFWSTTLLLAM